jgi:endoribonuclease Dicer
MEQQRVWPPVSQPRLVDDDQMSIDEPAVRDSAEQGFANDKGDDSDIDSEDSNEAKEWVVHSPRKPRKVSEKKRADIAAFDLWIEENQQQLAKSPNGLVINDDESVNGLVEDFDNKCIIASPRDYQLEMFERAKTQNTIAVLDTGKGPCYDCSAGARFLG